MMSTYMGRTPDTGDHVKAEAGAKDRMCLASYAGAIGDCVRPKGHEGWHQGAQFYSWRETDVRQQLGAGAVLTGWTVTPGQQQVLRSKLSHVPYSGSIALQPGSVTSWERLVDWLDDLAELLVHHAEADDAQQRELSALRVQRAAVRAFLGTDVQS